MSEQEQSVEEILSELDTLIGGSGDLADDQRALLTSAVGQIREALDRGDQAAERDTLMGRLRETLEDFEEDHPRLTALVGRVADSLSDLGI